MRNIRTIIVEDEPLIRINIVKKIENANLDYEIVATAKNGEQALELTESLSPDVIITDIRMPKSDGLTLCKHLNEKYPHIKKIIISGHSDFDYAREAIKYNVKDYILKPVDENTLFEVLNKTRAAIAIDNNQYLDIVDLNAGSELLVENTKTYIKENISSPINIQTIADNMNVSISYLSKLFKKHVGISPSKYVTELKINKSKHLLHNKDLNIKQISELTGYSDQHYFSRVFKNVTGQSPQKYRDNLED